MEGKEFGKCHGACIWFVFASLSPPLSFESRMGSRERRRRRERKRRKEGRKDRFQNRAEPLSASTVTSAHNPASATAELARSASALKGPKASESWGSDPAKDGGRGPCRDGERQGESGERVRGRQRGEVGERGLRVLGGELCSRGDGEAEHGRPAAHDEGPV